MKYINFQKISNPASIFLAVLIFLAACQSHPQVSEEAKSNAGAYIDGLSQQGFDRNKGVPLPALVEPIETKISGLNYWSENLKFVVAGMVENPTNKWYRFYLKVTFRSASGQPVKVNSEDQVYIPVATSVIPPLGRSSFCWNFDQFAFSEPVASCEITVAGGTKEAEKLQLSASDQSMLNAKSGIASDPSKSADSSDMAKAEILGCQVSANIYNPFDKPVMKPMTQVIIYGKDQKIWYATVAPIDSSDQMIFAAKSGPIQPKEKRLIGMGILFQALPAELQKVGVLNIELLPFDGTSN